jgi:methylenetetrahydrofolate reductase (NADPH)
VRTTDVVADEALKDRIIAFAGDASIEATPHDEERLRELTAHLRAGTTVYIAHPPRWLLQDVVRVAVKIRKLGFHARPHIVARALHSERQLRAVLSELNAAGIEQMLLVAGDANAPAGPFSSAMEVLGTGATVDCGMKTVAVAGHPEGHQVIGRSLLWDALQSKQAFAQRTGTCVPVVTQFGFIPQAVFDWRRECLERGIALPAHVGLAGPTPLPRLIHFAMQCGIGASLRALARGGSALTGLARMTATPEEMLTSLVRRRAAGDDASIMKPHFFCFGGSLETARWLRKVTEGSFDLNADCSRFIVRA